MQAEDVRDRDSILECLEHLRRLHHDLSLVDICALILVSENPGVTLAELAGFLDVTTVTASRALRTFAERDFKHALPPALGLVEIYKSREDGRSIKARLTSLGESAVRTLNAHVEKGARI
jgi:DNA-binding MarR family transcriptional regulator